jgi:hypothetical protein
MRSFFEKKFSWGIKSKNDIDPDQGFDFENAD